MLKISHARLQHWRRQWHPTPVLLPGKSHGWDSMAAVHGVTNSWTRLHFHFSVSCIGEGNGNPLQCSCLENPKDGGAWWAAVYGVTQSQTWLKRLSSSGRLQHSVSQELPDALAGFRKGRGTRDQMANIHWIIEKGRESQKKTSTSVSSPLPKPLTVWIIINCGKLLKRWEYETILPVSWETCMQVKKPQLEPCMKQLISSGLKKEYDRAVCCNPVCLIYMLSTSWGMPGWMSYKLEPRLMGETLTTSLMWMIQLMAESEEELKSPLMQVKESERASLELNIKKQTNKQKKN